MHVTHVSPSRPRRVILLNFCLVRSFRFIYIARISIPLSQTILSLLLWLTIRYFRQSTHHLPSSHYIDQESWLSFHSIFEYKQFFHNEDYYSKSTVFFVFFVLYINTFILLNENYGLCSQICRSSLKKFYPPCCIVRAGKYLPKKCAVDCFFCFLI